MPVYTKAPVRHGNPNIVLVILLVVFVLSSIGMGLWGYSGMADQKELEDKAKKKEDEVKALSLAKEYYVFVAAEMRLILGHTLKEKNPDEVTPWKSARKEFFKKKDGKFGNDKSPIPPEVRDIYYDLFDQAEKAQGFDPEKGEYNTVAPKKEEAVKDPADGGDKKEKGGIWEAKMAEKENIIKAQKAEIQDLRNRLAKADKRDDAVQAKNEANYRKLLKEITQNAKAALDKASEQSEALKQSFVRNSELVNEYNVEKEKHDEVQRSWFAELRKFESKIAKLEQEKADLLLVKVDPVAAPKGDGKKEKKILPGTYLALDVSMGRPLFDRPVGAVVSVSPAGDKMLIELYKDDGVEERLKLRTKATFNVFAAGRDKLADKQLKATIEVINVTEGRFAEARVTARFGDKIPIADGDLLFSMAWGTHVAVAGNVNLFGKYRGESQLEQARSLKQFMTKLEDMGVIVDAYIDLTDGSVKGKYGSITNKTRFLIRGYDLDPARGVATALAEIPEPEKGEDKEKTDKIRNEIKELATKRIETINKAIEKMRDEAVETGLFVISPENFANVAGYRKIGGYGATDDPPFAPRVIAPNLP